MTEQDKNEQNMKVASFLWDLILWVLGSYVLKTSWNYSLRQMFPLPYMNFSNAIAILSFVYIVARVAAIGFMTEVSRNVVTAMETISEELKKATDKLKFSVQRNQSSEDDSNLN